MFSPWVVNICIVVNRIGAVYDSAGMVKQTDHGNSQTSSMLLDKNHSPRHDITLLTNILYNASLAKKTSISSNAVVASKFSF